MAFDNLWDIYEGDGEPKGAAGQAVKEPAPEYTPPGYGKGADARGPMPGVFGTGAGNAGNAAEGPRGAETRSPGSPGRRRFDRGRMRYWPWVDIICIAITVIMVICVLVNFEEVTTALFCTLLPLLSNLVVLLLVVGVIAFAIWRIARGPRGPRRRW